MTGGAGYTLLELLVVLAIIGMVSAIAAPPTLRLVSAWQAKSAFDDAERQIARLPMEARRQGRPLVVATPDDWPQALGDWPEGLDVLAPLSIAANGYCHGGRVAVDTLGRRHEVDVLPPYCRIGGDEARR